MSKEGAIHTSILTVINVSAALDYAVFTCTAHNSMGQDSLDIQLLSTSMYRQTHKQKACGLTTS